MPLLAWANRERRKLLVDPAKIEHSIDPPYHVISWNYFIEMECVEELPLTLCQPTHHVLPPTLIASASPNHASQPPSMTFCNTIRLDADDRISHFEMRRSTGSPWTASTATYRVKSGHELLDTADMRLAFRRVC
jgi:hypothetical protein